MSTETLRRGDNLAVAQGDGAATPFGISCSNGCGAPMQSIDTIAFAHRCSACDEITVDPHRFGPIEDVARSSVNRALFELIALQQMLKRSAFAVFVQSPARCEKMVPASTAFTSCSLPEGHTGECATFVMLDDPRNAVSVSASISGSPLENPTLQAVERIIEILKDESIEGFADAVHSTAIAAAARICALRAESQFRDSKNWPAGLEAGKCAFAIQRLRKRSSLADRPELFTDNPLAPEPAHA